MKVDFNAILEVMEFQNDKNTGYLNVKTGDVVVLSDEVVRAAEEEDDLSGYPEWERGDIEIARDIYVNDSPDYLELPDRFEINEYRMMETFIGTVENPDFQRQLARSIEGGGAFRRFKDVAGDLGLLEAWYACRKEEYKRVAREWCEVNGVDYIEGD